MYNEYNNPLSKFKVYISDPLYVRETGYFVRLREFENVLHHLEKKDGYKCLKTEYVVRHREIG